MSCLPSLRLTASTNLRLSPPVPSLCIDSRTDMINLNGKDLMMWFHRMELLARLGVIREIKELRGQLDSLTKMVCQQSGIFAHRSPKHTRITSLGGVLGLIQD